MNITDQDCFKQAVEIAGWPEWVVTNKKTTSTHLLRLSFNGVRWDVCFWSRNSERWLVSTQYNPADVFAEALLEKHFRKWLEERRRWIEPFAVFGTEGRIVYSAWTDSASCGSSGGRQQPIAVADTYLECACLAVIECEKKENDPDPENGEDDNEDDNEDNYPPKPENHLDRDCRRYHERF